MGSRESSLSGHQTTIEPFTVRATESFDFPAQGSGSSFSTTFPVHTRSGSSSLVADYPFHGPKGSSSSMIGTNTSSYGYYNNHNSNISSTKGKPSGVIAFHSSAQWKAHFDAAKDSDKLVISSSNALCIITSCNFIEQSDIKWMNHLLNITIFVYE